MHPIRFLAWIHVFRSSHLTSTRCMHPIRFLAWIHVTLLFCAGYLARVIFSARGNSRKCKVFSLKQSKRSRDPRASTLTAYITHISKFKRRTAYEKRSVFKVNSCLSGLFPKRKYKAREIALLSRESALNDTTCTECLLPSCLPLAASLQSLLSFRSLFQFVEQLSAKV